MPQEASSPPGGEKPQLSIGVPNAVVETNYAKDLFKMTIPPLCGTIVQIFFLPRTGLNKSWVPLADSPIMYFRGKGAIWSRFSSSRRWNSSCPSRERRPSWWRFCGCRTRTSPSPCRRWSRSRHPPCSRLPRSHRRRSTTLRKIGAKGWHVCARVRVYVYVL